MPVRSKAKARASPTEARLLYEAVDKYAQKQLKTHTSRIFTTDLNYRDLWSSFLGGLPASKRQEYTCHQCRSFVKRVGNLALVSNDGTLTPLFWSTRDVPESMKDAVDNLAKHFQIARVVSEYKPVVGSKSQWAGKELCGGFRHFQFTFPRNRTTQAVPRGVSVLSTQQAAEMLNRVLADYSLGSIKKAVQILTQHKLPNASNHISAAEYLLNIVSDNHIPKEDGAVRHNLLHRDAANAFVGCVSQLRSGPLSILLGLLESNTAFSEIQRQWTSLTAPENYMRPTATPSTGNVEASERLFTELGLTANDMRRRFMSIDELPNDIYLWRRKTATTRPKKPKTELKIFGSVAAAAAATPASKTARPAETDLPPTPLSFTKFVTSVLPHATRVWAKVHAHKPIAFMISGLEGTMPLMQWHDDTNRASMYVYTTPRHVSQHGLQADAWNEVRGVVPMPWLWDVAGTVNSFPLPSMEELRKAGDAEQEGDAGGGVDGGGKRRGGLKYYHTKNGLSHVFLLDGVYDKSLRHLCLFPTWLRGELHGARKTIERYSELWEKELPEGIEEKGGYVGGVIYGQSNKASLVLRTQGGKDGKGEGVWEVTCYE